MMALIWKLIVGGLWKPIAWVLGALGLYFKGRSDAKAKQTKARMETMEKANEVRNAIDAKSDAAVRGDLGKWVRPE